MTDFFKIPLSQGLFALVDAEDYDLVKDYKWCADFKNGRCYAMRKIKRTITIRMHRLILGLTPGDGKIVDHKNGNGLDNRRENIHIVSHRGNALNSNRVRNAKGNWLNLRRTRYEVRNRSRR